MVHRQCDVPSIYSRSKDFYTTDYFTKYAIGWLDEYQNEDKPFFLYLAYTAPHDPLMAWPEDIARYKGKYDSGYEEIRRQRYRKQKELGLIDDTYTLSEPKYEEWSTCRIKCERMKSGKWKFMQQ